MLLAVLAIAVGPPLGTRLVARLRVPTRETRISVIGSSERREAARAALARESVRTALASGDPSLRGFAAEAVLAFGAEALRPLLEELESLPKERRDPAGVTAIATTAARAVGEDRSPAARLGFTSARCEDPVPDDAALARVEASRRDAARAAWIDVQRDRCSYFARLLREDGLLVALTGPDEVRRAAAEALASLRTEPSPGVIDLLGDSAIREAFAGARDRVSRLVHGHPDSPLEDAIERIRAALSTTPDPPFDVAAALGPLAAHERGRFFAAAVRWGGTARPMLDLVLDLEDPDLRHWAAWALRELSASPPGSAALAARAADPDPELRRHAVIATARSAASATAAVEHLAAALRDPAAAVRRDAARELASAGAAGVTALAEALTSSEDELRIELARALTGARPLDGASGALASVLPESDAWTAGAIETALACARAAGAEAVVPLARSGDVGTRRRALVVLAAARMVRPPTEVLSALAQALDDDDPQVRRSAAAALAAVDPALRDSLAEALERHARLDPDPGARARAARAVGGRYDEARRS